MMNHEEVSQGESSKNSVSYFLTGEKNGVKAKRLENGTIEVKRCVSDFKDSELLNFIGVLLLTGIFKKLVLWLNLPIFLYHIPTIIWIIVVIVSLMKLRRQKEELMYHGAENKVFNWYKENKDEIMNYGFVSDDSYLIPPNLLQPIKNCSIIVSSSWSNILGTFLAFQILSSISIIYWHLSIPEIATILLPFLVYKIFPFNFLGLILQPFTTTEPTNDHIAVAYAALMTLVRSSR